MSCADIAAALGDARREGRTWRCRCPLHGGHSLNLRDGDRDRVLVTCWGGFNRSDVLAELRRGGLLAGRMIEWIGSGVLRASKAGKRTIITADDLRECVAHLPPIEPKPAGRES